MKMFQPLNLLLYGISFFSCKNIVSKNSNEDKVITTAISFKLKKNEKCIFNYCDIYFKHHELIFSNPGNKDSIITKNITLDKPTVLKCGFFESKNPQINILTNYFFLVNPGDSITYSFFDGRNIEIDSLHTNMVLSNPKYSYFHKYINSIEKNILARSSKEWEINYNKFYSKLKEAYHAENKRIDSLFKQRQTDSAFTYMLKLHSEVLYYKNLFNYIGENEKYFDLISIHYIPEISGAKKLLNKDKLFLTPDLIDIFYGILRVNLISKNKDYKDPNFLFNEALQLDVLNFKPGLLTSFLNWVPKDSDIYKRVSDEICSHYVNTKYSNQVIALQEEISRINMIQIEDTLIQLSGNSIRWDELVNNKNDSVILIDFWASWCTPCRDQIPLLESAKTFFIHYPIKFISVNIDRDKNDWVIASKAEEKYLKQNNYHLIFNKKEGIIKKYMINAIPRYILFKNGKVLSNEFPSPAEPNFTERLKKVIDSNK